MAFTYDTSTDRGRVRLLVADTVDSGHIWEDAEVDAMLDLTESVYLAAARLIRAGAVNAARRAAILRVMDVEADNTKALQALLAIADGLEEAAQSEDGCVDWAEMVTTPAGLCERWRQLEGIV